MGFWNWFGKKSDDSVMEEALPEIKKEDFVDDSNPNSNKTVTITYGTGMPIE